MDSQYDIVIIGFGHNALIAAAYLGKAGQRVLVLERSDCFGGGVVTREIVAPASRTTFIRARMSTSRRIH